MKPVSENDNYKKYAIFVAIMASTFPINFTILYIGLNWVPLSPDASSLWTKNYDNADHLKVWDFIDDYQIIIEKIVTAIAIGDIILIIATAIIMFRISKKQDRLNHLRFKREKKWFLIILKILAVMLITWAAEVFPLNETFNENLLMTSDIIKLYSALVLFNILILRDEAIIVICKKF